MKMLFSSTQKDKLHVAHAAQGCTISREYETFRTSLQFLHETLCCECDHICIRAQLSKVFLNVIGAHSCYSRAHSFTTCLGAPVLGRHLERSTPYEVGNTEFFLGETRSKRLTPHKIDTIHGRQRII
jgi:hypothetical protein